MRKYEMTYVAGRGLQQFSMLQSTLQNDDDATGTALLTTAKPKVASCNTCDVFKVFAGDVVAKPLMC